MAEYVIRVVIDASNARPAIAALSAGLGQVEQAGGKARPPIQRLQSETDLLNEKLNALGRLMHGVFAVQGVVSAVAGITQLSDAYTVLQNKLRTVTDSESDLILKTEETFELAQRLRTEWSATSQVFSRISRSTEDLGLTQSQVMKITENLTKTIKVSGATANETRSVLLQLGQAFSSGKLAGDEFRSAMENASEIGNVLAASMGVTRGELKQLSRDGKITSAVLARAFLEPSAIFQKFSESVPTFAERWTMLKNAATKFVGEWAKTSALMKVLGGTLAFVTENVDVLARGIAALGTVLLTVLVARAIPATIAALNALRIAALANPFTAIATGIAALVAAFGDFPKVIDGNGRQLEGLEAHGYATAKALNEMAHQTGTLEEGFRRVGREAATAAGYSAGFIEQVEKRLQNAQAAARGVASISTLSLATAPALIKAVTESAIKNTERMIKAQEKARQEAERARNAYESLAGSVDSQQGAWFQLAKASDVLTESIRRGYITAEEAFVIWDRLYEKLVDVNSVTRDLAGSGGFVEMTTEVDGLTESVLVQQAAFASAAAGLAASQVQRDQLLIQMGEEQESAKRAAEAYAALPAAQREFIETTNALSDAYAEGAIHVTDYNAALADAELALLAAEKGSKSLEYGIASGWDALKDQATDVAGAMEAAFTNAYAGIENALVDLVVTGKTDFKGLVDSMLGDLTRVLARLAFTSLLAGDYGKAAAAGGAVGAGALFSSLGGLRTGGQFQVGGSGGPDSQVVAFRASPKETVSVTTPSQNAKGNFGGSPAPVINIYNVNDSREVSAIDTPAGGRAINNVIRKNPQIVRSRNR